MTRRPKLSLVPDRDPEKKQMPELGPEDSAAAQSAAAASEIPSSRPRERSHTEQPSTAPARNPTWANATQIAKVVLVVAATALSLYLLKRRLF